MTGVQTCALPICDASEAVFREALAVVAAYRSRPTRPALSEIAVDPRFGFSLFLLEGGAEVRLWRGEYNKKLASLDQIFEAVRTSGSPDLRTLRIVHLDVADLRAGRVPVRLAGDVESHVDDSKGIAKAVAKPEAKPVRKRAPKPVSADTEDEEPAKESTDDQP